MGDYISPPVCGPGPVGQLAAIAAGLATDIVDIIAPSEAVYGGQVSIEVRLKNIYDAPMYLSVSARYNGIDIAFTPSYVVASPGGTYSFLTSFTMPNKAIRLDVWSFYWTGAEWIEDDHDSVNIALVAAPEPYAGTITRMELEYDEARANIPAYNIPQGKRGLVHIWGRNDMSTTQQMGISWFIYDPDGYEVERYSDWEFWPYTGPGREHGFIGGRFNLDKAGTYQIYVSLLMNPDAPIIVDVYYGNLCTVAPLVPSPQFRGFGVTEYVTVEGG